MKLFPAMILPLTALLLWPGSAPAASVASTKPLVLSLRPSSRSTQTVISVHLHGTAMLLQLSNGIAVSSVDLSASSLTTNDGRPLANASIRPGDQVDPAGHGLLQDTSQRLVTMRGVICHAPAQAGDTLAIEHNQVCSILVDTQAGTQYSDRSSVVARISLLQEGDVVQIHGVYDSSAEEMTQTNSLVRLGPVQKPLAGAIRHA